MSVLSHENMCLLVVVVTHMCSASGRRHSVPWLATGTGAGVRGAVLVARGSRVSSTLRSQVS